ncbi:MAG TPA: methyltransferase domain-containing protein [Acidimicrobiales bacterium]|nr:methyltransferase domain-containing protein [Acidimicrobiales bacterium]
MTHTAPTPIHTDRNLARQQRFWTRRAASWDHGAGNNPGLVKVVNAVLAEAEPRPDEHAVDLGCGSGQVTLSLAGKVASVLAIDISEKMIRLLLEHAGAAGVTNVDGRATPVEELDFEPGSVDLVVSNYALHHLRDADKPVLVRRAYQWLRPGGRLVIGDMMFGRGGDSRDREIIASKLTHLARKGPAGWWRIAKNAGRYLLRFQERPVSIAAWEKMMRDAGFDDVRSTQVVNEAAVVRGLKR